MVIRCNRLPRLLPPYTEASATLWLTTLFLNIVCLTTYFHYLLPTVSAVYRGNRILSSLSSYLLPRVYIETLELYLQSSRLFNSPILQSLYKGRQ